MDDSFHDLEAELKALSLRRPSARLQERLARDLASPVEGNSTPARSRYTTATNLGSWKWLGWRTAGLAAGVALVAVLGLLRSRQSETVETAPVTPPVQLAETSRPVVRPPHPAVAASDDRYGPVAAANVLYDLQDEGAVASTGDVQAHRVRYRYLDTYTWKNPRSNASLKWSVPRDEIRVIPASLN